MISLTTLPVTVAEWKQVAQLGVFFKKALYSYSIEQDQTFPHIQKHIYGKYKIRNLE